MSKVSQRMFIGLLVIVCLAIIGSALAQPSIPLPSSLDSRTSVELLNNADFEIDSNNDKIPDSWTDKNINIPRSDKLKCDQPGKLVAHTGACAFMFRGNLVAGTSKIQQNIADTSAIVNGSSVTFSVFVDARSGLPGSKIGNAKIVYSDGTSTKFALTIPTVARGVEDYVQLTDTKTIAIPAGSIISQVKVDFRYNRTTGKFFIDAASLTVNTDNPTATSTHTVTNTLENTTIPSTATQTEMPPTATNTPTADITATPTNTATPCTSICQLLANDGAANDQFGNTVAIDGDTAVVGSPSNIVNTGAAYIFTRNAGVWTQQQKLTASDGAINDYFGFSVAINGNTVVVGANRKDGNKGSAYVFTYDGTTWTEQQKLTASDGAANHFFGVSVAISGETAAIGATGNAGGVVYAFVRTGTNWAEQQKLAHDFLVNAGSPFFGANVAISGETIVVGAANETINTNDSRGSAYVFTRSGITWTKQQKLIASDGAANESFGGSVRIAGDTIAVGAAGDDFGANTNQGSAYVFTRSGATWTEQQKLIASDGAAGDFFGRSIDLDLDGDTVSVGAPSVDIGANTNQGAVYVFTFSGTTWTQQQKLTASDGAANDSFGWSVALSSNTTVVGVYADDIGANVNQGSAWVFDLLP